MSRSLARRDYLFGALAIGLAVLAAMQLVGGAWWLIAEGDTGVLLVTPVVVLVEVLLARAVWRRTTWTKHPAVPGEWRDRHRALSPREIVCVRWLLVGVPVLALLGWGVGWWGWTFLLIVLASLVFQWLVAPGHHRRQILRH